MTTTRLPTRGFATFSFPAAVLGLVGAFSSLAGCGGGGSAGSTDPNAPQNLAYGASTMVVRVDEPAVPNMPTWTNGDPISFFCTTTLPDGLVLDPTSGVISGTPTDSAPMAVFTIVASNDAGDDSTDVSIAVYWPEEKSLLPVANPSDDDLRHFLERTHFGFSETHYNLVQQVGLEAYIEAMTALPPQTQIEQEARVHLVDDNDPNAMFPSHDDITNWWMHLMVASGNPFQELCALHWHDHFATSSDVLEGGNTHFMVNHVNLLRSQATGNLRTLLLALARDWAMLEWLDGVENHYNGNNYVPQENFCREWYELFCLGVDNGYTQQDIVEGARAFSGYRRRFNATTGQSYLEFFPNFHDPAPKTVLGTVIPGQNVTDDFAAMTDITMGLVDPATGRKRVALWAARSILRRFCMDVPAPELIEQLAEAIENANWELKPAFDVLFQSEAFYSAAAKEGLAKMPIEHFTGFQRTTLCYALPNEVRRRAAILGNVPSRPPSVDGWAEGASWFSAQAMIDRANVTQYLVRGAKATQDSLGVDLRDLLPSAQPTSTEVVAALALRLRLALSPQDAADMALYLDTTRTSGGVVNPSLFDATNQAHIDERVRGLLYIMSQHPSYLTR